METEGFLDSMELQLLSVLLSSFEQGAMPEAVSPLYVGGIRGEKESSIWNTLGLLGKPPTGKESA